MAVNPRPESELLRLVYDAAMQSLDAQRGTVDEPRGRAGVVLTAASIASSFLGGFTLSNDAGLGLWSTLAIAAFVAIGLLVFVILWPYGWQFGFEPHDLVRDYVDAEPPPSTNEAQRSLTIYAGDYLADNDRRLTALWWLYRGAIVGLVMLIAFWLIGLGTASP
jgi:hypothetical protein